MPTCDNTAGGDHAQTWNEVNFNVSPRDSAPDADGELARDLWEGLVGLLYVRTSGNDADLANLRRLRDHWKSLGREVPLFAVNAEVIETVRYWRPDVKIDLARPPYNLTELT